MIATHNGVKGKYPRIDINKYPAVKDHLDQYWDKISTRADKGDTPYNLRNCAYWDLFFQPHICWKAVGRQLTFALVDGGVYLTAPASFISAGDYNQYILACLCSDLGRYFIYRNSDTTGAGDIMLNIQSLIKFPIPTQFDREYVNKILYNADRDNLVNLYLRQLFGFSDEEWEYICHFN